MFVNLEYDAAGFLKSVADPFGRKLQFTYDANERLETMLDPAGGVYRYNYDGIGNFIGVTHPDLTVRGYLNKSTPFSWGGTLPNALIGIVDEQFCATDDRASQPAASCIP
jgi:YD repeat-containing protein